MGWALSSKYIAIGALGVLGLRWATPRDVWERPESHPVAGPLCILFPAYAVPAYGLQRLCGHPPAPLWTAYLAMASTIFTSHSMAVTRAHFSKIYPYVLAYLCASSLLRIDAM